MVKSKKSNTERIRCSKEFKIREFNVDKPKRNKYYCSRSCANSRKQTEETKAKISKSIKKYGLKYVPIKHTPKINKICPICKKDFEVNQCLSKQIYCSKKCYKSDKHCEFRSKGIGGYRKGSGRGKSGWYKEYWCDSSYELAFVIYNIENGIVFERNYSGFTYQWKGKSHTYYPDFIVNGKYYEIKGYESEQDKYKYVALENQLTVLYKNDLEYIFLYVKNKYGNDYIKLFDNNPHHKLNNVCKVCGTPCKSKNIYCSRGCAIKKWETIGL
jgi:hypothetical protein